MLPRAIQKILDEHHYLDANENKKFFSFLKKLVNKDPIFFSLIENWDPPRVNDEKKIILLKKIFQLNNAISEGLENYALSTKKLYQNHSLQKKLKKLQNFSSPKSSIELKELNKNFIQLEEVAINHLDKVVITLIAGGVGERLGFTDIKLKLKTHQIYSAYYLDYYCQMIKSLELVYFQKKNKKIAIPLIVMVSEQTYAETLLELERKKYNGLKKSQIIFLKQKSVPCFANLKGDFAFAEEYQLVLKPGGHGAIHSLIYNDKVIQKKLKNYKYLFFMQDTNIQVVNVFLSSLGVLLKEKSHVAWLGVVRSNNEKIGLIVQEKEKIFNLEYNLIEEEKTNQESENYLGNTNMFWLDYQVYQKILSDKKGLIKGFINPKFQKDNKTFSSPNRQESLMQDVIKEFPEPEKITTLAYPRSYAFTPVKNKLITLIANPQEKAYTALQAEEIDFRNNRNLIAKEASNKILTNKNIFFLKDIFISDEVKVYLHPYCRVFSGATSFIKNSLFYPQSILIVNLPLVSIDKLVLKKKSSLIIQGHPEATLKISELTIDNKGYILTPLKKKNYHDENFSIFEKLFGYQFQWENPLVIHLPKKGNYLLDKTGKIIKE